jgi:hypothetical protein
MSYHFTGAEPLDVGGDHDKVSEGDPEVDAETTGAAGVDGGDGGFVEPDRSLKWMKLSGQP